MSAACAYYATPAYLVSVDKQFNTEQNDYLMWQQQYQRRLDEEKANDPKTFIGWALKGIIK